MSSNWRRDQRLPDDRDDADGEIRCSTAHSKVPDRHLVIPSDISLRYFSKRSPWFHAASICHFIPPTSTVLDRLIYEAHNVMSESYAWGSVAPLFGDELI